MPKGGDLHHHLSGGAFPEWYWDLALAGRPRAPLPNWYALTTAATAPMRLRSAYLLYFHTISEQRWQGLDACARGSTNPSRR